MVGWTANFADALHQIPVARGSAPDTHMKLIPNFSLGGSQPTDPLIVALTNAIDGALPEVCLTATLARSNASLADASVSRLPLNRPDLLTTAANARVLLTGRLQLHG